MLVTQSGVSFPGFITTYFGLHLLCWTRAFFFSPGFLSSTSLFTGLSGGGPTLAALVSDEWRPVSAICVSSEPETVKRLKLLDQEGGGVEECTQQQEGSALMVGRVTMGALAVSLPKLDCSVQGCMGTHRATLRLQQGKWRSG